MRIFTYNLNGINARLPVLTRWLKEVSPEVVCLQELKSPDEKIPKQDIEDLGYQALWYGQKRWNGVAILAKEGLSLREVSRGLPGDPEDEQSRFIEAEVNKIHISCLYLPNGNPAPGPKFDYKLEWFGRLLDHAAALYAKDIPVVLTGDFNVMPTEKDVYKPERWGDDALFRPESRAAFKELEAQGWTDALRSLFPDKTIFTFWDYYRNAFQRDAGLRIDHFMLSPQLVPKLQDAGVDREIRSWEKSSDHAPVWISLDWE